MAQQPQSAELPPRISVARFCSYCRCLRHRKWLHCCQGVRGYHDVRFSPEVTARCSNKHGSRIVHQMKRCHGAAESVGSGCGAQLGWCHQSSLVALQAVAVIGDCWVVGLRLRARTGCQCRAAWFKGGVRRTSSSGGVHHSSGSGELRRFQLLQWRCSGGGVLHCLLQ